MSDAGDESRREPDQRAYVPGPFSYAITALATAGSLYSTSLPGWNVGLAAIAFAACLSCGAAWGILFVAATAQSRGRFERTAAARWLGVPLVLLLCALAVTSGQGLNVRFALSRSALDQAVASEESGTTPSPGWIGLFPVASVGRLGGPGAVFVDVDGTGFLNCGFLHKADGRPEIADLGQEVSDGWWVWCPKLYDQ